MKRRFLWISLMLLLLGMLALAGCAADGGEEAMLISSDNISGDLVYSIYAGNTVTITGYTGARRY